ncbi:MAG: HEPN domain-containing protein [Nitrospirota bacterium]
MLDRIKIAEEWFNRGKHDIEGAEILFESGHYTDTIAMLIQQAIEKYLKGFLVFNGWRLAKIHDLEKLVTEAMAFDTNFEDYLDFARKITAYYVEERYPPGPAIDYPREEIGEALTTAKEIIEIIKETVK